MRFVTMFYFASGCSGCISLETFSFFCVVNIQYYHYDSTVLSFIFTTKKVIISYRKTTPSTPMQKSKSKFEYSVGPFCKNEENSLFSSIFRLSRLSQKALCYQNNLYVYIVSAINSNSGNKGKIKKGEKRPIFSKNKKMGE